MKNEQIEELLRELGPLTAQLQAVEREPDDGIWHLIFADDDGARLVRLALLNTPESRKLQLMAPIGMLNADTATSTAEAALRFNADAMLASGYRIALGEDRELLLLGDVVTASVDAGGLAKEIEAFAAGVLTWQVILAPGGITETAASETPPPAPGKPGITIA